MSRQNKNIKKRILAAEITKMHKSGQKGPSSTARNHTKQDKNRAYTRLTRGLKDMKNLPKRG